MIRNQVCVSIVGRRGSDVLAAAIEAEERGADLIEIRLDWMESLNKESLGDLFRSLSQVGLPKIATIMPRGLFGRFDGSEPQRVELLQEAAPWVDYVDVGLEMDVRLIRGCLEGIGDTADLILSKHSGRPLSGDEIRSMVGEHGGDHIYKIVMPASSLQDNLVALEASQSLIGFRRIIFCFGRLGVISRVLAPFFGSEWTYASLGRGREAAPGQVDIESLKSIQGGLMQ